MVQSKAPLLSNNRFAKPPTVWLSVDSISLERLESWLIDGTLVVPDDAATDIGHAVGGRAGLDQ